MIYILIEHWCLKGDDIYLFACLYALIICYHGPDPGECGDSRGNERGVDQSFATVVRGKYPDFAI